MTKRREFIKKSTLGTAGIVIGGMGFSKKMCDSIQGANDRIFVAVIGLRGQGGTHINNWCDIKDTRNVRIKALCDADEQFFPERIKSVADKTGENPITFWDMRKVFDDKDIDAVSSALPALANISYRLGRQLTFDGASEKFIKDKEADKMLTREYRKPYVVPEEI